MQLVSMIGYERQKIEEIQTIMQLSKRKPAAFLVLVS